MKMRAPKGEGALTLADLDGQTGGLVALAGRELLRADRYGVGGLIDPLLGVFGRGNVYIELQRHLLRDEDADNRALIDLAAAFHVPLLATNGVRFADPAERPLFDVLTCIRRKTDLAHAGRKLARNAERYLKPPEEMARLFGDLPAALAATGDACRAAAIHDGRSRLSLSGVSRSARAKPRRRFSASSPISARASGTGRITIARARRLRASSI